MVFIGGLVGIWVPVYTVIDLKQRGFSQPDGVLEWGIVLVAGAVLVVVLVAWVFVLWTAGLSWWLDLWREAWTDVVDAARHIRAHTLIAARERKLRRAARRL